MARIGASYADHLIENFDARDLGVLITSIQRALIIRYGEFNQRDSFRKSQNRFACVTASDALEIAKRAIWDELSRCRENARTYDEMEEQSAEV